MASSRESRQQRLIEHEMRLSRTRALIDRYAAWMQERDDARDAGRETAWVRRRMAEMIAGASPDELHALGVTDEVVREMRLGTSLRDAWSRLHPPPPSVFRDEPRPRE
jgi:hypothetical protein